MKAIMISIKPEWVSKILNGEKTIEIRKTCPTQLRGDTPVKPEPIDVYIYCSKCKKGSFCREIGYIGHRLDGYVVAKFTLNKVEKFTNDDLWAKCFKTDELIAKSCVRFSQITAYSCASSIYAWHIDNLEIFDTPKELINFYKYHFMEDTSLCDKNSHFRPYLKVKKAPQSWCYVEVEK